MKEEDKDISLMFDDLKRSTAIFKLAMWKKNGILSKESFEELSKETQEHIDITWILHVYNHGGAYPQIFLIFVATAGVALYYYKNIGELKKGSKTLQQIMKYV